MATLADLKKARVTIEVGGEKYELIPSPEAILALSSKYDGIAPLIAAIGRMNVHAMADTVISGLGLKDSAAREMLKAVAGSSLVDLAPKLTDFAIICSNGGRPLVEEQANDGGAEGGKNPL